MKIIIYDVESRLSLTGQFRVLSHFKLKILAG